MRKDFRHMLTYTISIEFGHVITKILIGIKTNYTTLNTVNQWFTLSEETHVDAVLSAVCVYWPIEIVNATKN
jgi:hypothetical protein